MPDHGKTFHSWEIHEYAKHERPTWWYVVAGIVFVALVGYSIATFNFMFALIVIIAAILVALSGMREPRLISFAITEDGLEIDRDFYPWTTVKNFWIVYEPGDIKALYLNFKNLLRPRLAVPLDHDDPVELRSTLLKYLPEDHTREGEPITEYLGRVLKI